MSALDERVRRAARSGMVKTLGLPIRRYERDVEAEQDRAYYAQLQASTGATLEDLALAETEADENAATIEELWAATQRSIDAYHDAPFSMAVSLCAGTCGGYVGRTGWGKGRRPRCPACAKANLDRWLTPAKPRRMSTCGECGTRYAYTHRYLDRCPDCRPPILRSGTCKWCGEGFTVEVGRHGGRRLDYCSPGHTLEARRKRNRDRKRSKEHAERVAA